MWQFFTPGLVTRRMGGTAAHDMEWAAVDVETTGLDPAGDRIVEIGIVRFRGDGTVLDEYCTMVNPQRSEVGTEFHTLTAQDLAEAPTFGEVLPDVTRMLAGTITVAHKLVFEEGFLAAERARTALPGPVFPAVCSLVAAQSQLQGVTFALASLHKSLTGEWFEDAHTALGDARALARTWSALLDQAPRRLFYLGPSPVLVDPTAYPIGRIAPRPAAVSSPRLDEFTSRFPRSTVEYRTTPEARDEYLAALRLVVDDEVITTAESTRLEKLARSAGLTQHSLEAAHQQVWEEILAATPDDARQLPAQQQRLEQLATNLGLRGARPRLTPEDRAQRDVAALQPQPERYLRGWRIGIDPTAATAPVAELAARHGANIAKRLTATVRWVVAGDPEGDTPTLVKARDLGLKIITVAQATRVLDQEIAAAQAKEAERIASEQRWQHERAERDQNFRHTWRATELPPDWDGVTTGTEPAAPIIAATLHPVVEHPLPVSPPPVATAMPVEPSPPEAIEPSCPAPVISADVSPEQRRQEHERGQRDGRAVALRLPIEAFLGLANSNFDFTRWLETWRESWRLIAAGKAPAGSALPPWLPLIAQYVGQYAAPAETLEGQYKPAASYVIGFGDGLHAVWDSAVQGGLVPRIPAAMNAWLREPSPTSRVRQTIPDLRAAAWRGRGKRVAGSIGRILLWITTAVVGILELGVIIATISGGFSGPSVAITENIFFGLIFLTLVFFAASGPRRIRDRRRRQDRRPAG